MKKWEFDDRVIVNVPGEPEWIGFVESQSEDLTLTKVNSGQQSNPYIDVEIKTEYLTEYDPSTPN